METVPIDKLTMDEQNVRGEAWSSDEELIKSIEEHGVNQPILIRPIEGVEGKDYGIVAGSRRYHASIEVGLDKMPVVIKEMEDTQALAASINENKDRKDVSGKQVLYMVKKRLKTLNGSLTTQQKIELLQESVDEGGFGFTPPTARRYIAALNLPKEIQRKYQVTKSDSPRGDSQSQELSIKKAAMVGRELSKSHTAKEQEEVVEEITDMPEKRARDTVKEYKKKGDIDRAKETSKVKRNVSLVVTIKNGVEDKLADACLDRDISKDTLVENILKEWLEKEGYL